MGGASAGADDRRRADPVEDGDGGRHGGVSGRYKAWEEAAFEIAWILEHTGAVAGEGDDA